MEDWQEWQIRADQVAAGLGDEISALDRDFFSGPGDSSFRGFWPRFRDLKEKVRIAPAIKLEDKLALERRLRDLGSRAYKGQEASYARSQERRAELLPRIAELRERATTINSPRDLRSLRKELDAVRADFESGEPLVPVDRQAVWDAWHGASQFVWDRLTSIWDENETYLKDILSEARRALEMRDAAAVRQRVGKFFEALRTHECRQQAVNGLKGEANAIREQATLAERRQEADRVAAEPQQPSNPLEEWKAEVERNRISGARLADEVGQLERQVRESDSLLDQAMLRGTLVDKKRKLTEIERSNRTLAQRIEQAETTPVISNS